MEEVPSPSSKRCLRPGATTPAAGEATTAGGTPPAPPGSEAREPRAKTDPKERSPATAAQVRAATATELRQQRQQQHEHPKAQQERQACSHSQRRSATIQQEQEDGRRQSRHSHAARCQGQAAWFRGRTPTGLGRGARRQAGGRATGWRRSGRLCVPHDAYRGAQTQTRMLIARTCVPRTDAARVGEAEAARAAAPRAPRAPPNFCPVSDRS